MKYVIIDTLNLRPGDLKRKTACEYAGIKPSMHVYDMYGFLKAVGLDAICPNWEELSKEASDDMRKAEGCEGEDFYGLMRVYRMHHPGTTKDDVYREHLSKMGELFIKKVNEKAEKEQIAREEEKAHEADLYAMMQQAKIDALREQNLLAEQIEKTRKAEEEYRLLCYLNDLEERRRNW